MTELAARSEVDELLSGASALGIDLTSAGAAMLLKFLSRFYSWNRFGGFTRIPRRDGVRLHLLDSLSVARDLEGAESIIDLGTGGGMPGVPLALILGESEFVLVESRGRRCSFLKEIVREFALADRVDVIETDARDLVRSARRFDAVVSRAFLPPKELLDLGSGIIGPMGRIIVMGSSDDWLGEVGTTDLVMRSLRTLVLPQGDETRRIFRFERSRPADCFT